MSWWNSQCTHIWIFSVGRGNAAFLRTGLNQGFILDMGTGDLIDPAKFIQDNFLPRLDNYKGSKIAQVILSHPHADHVSQCSALGKGEKLYSSLLTCPHDKDIPPEIGQNEKVDWARIEDPSGQNKDLLDAYRHLFTGRCVPLQTINYDSSRDIPNLEYGIYYIRPPICNDLHSENTKYGNAMSLVFYLRHGEHTVLFPGDITPEAMELILEEKDGLEKRYSILTAGFSDKYPRWHIETQNQPSLKSFLSSRGLTILIAPHHGLESCYSEELYDAIRGGKPRLVVISERRRKNESPGRIDTRYQSEQGASGLDVEIQGKTERRRSITTVSGHHILIVFSGTGRPRVYANTDPMALLNIISS